MELLTGLLFCCSVSFDGFTIGCSYGLRNFKVNIYTNIIIALVSAGFTALALFCGRVILLFVPASTGTYIGTIFLFILGIYAIINGIFKNQSSEELDICRALNIKESFFMAVAVSIDAFSAGLGYAMTGHTSPLIPVGVGIFHSLFLTIGMGISRKAVHSLCFSEKFLSLLSGLIIIAVGLSRLFL